MSRFPKKNSLISCGYQYLQLLAHLETPVKKGLANYGGDGRVISLLVGGKTLVGQLGAEATAVTGTLVPASDLQVIGDVGDVGDVMAG